MASSLETNKIVAALLTAGIFASGAGVVSRMLYHPTTPEEPSYVIEVAATGTESGGDTAEPVEVDLGTLLASADSASGEKVYKKCSTCHTLEEGGANRVGPNLYGIVGRSIGTGAGFSYSSAMAGLDGSWNDQALDQFLANPKGYLPGTKMSFAGLKSGGDRADLILYLRTFSPDAPPLPEAQASNEEAGDAAAIDTQTQTAADAGAETPATTTAVTAPLDVDKVEDAAAEIIEAATSVVDDAQAAAEEIVTTATTAASETIDAAQEVVAGATEAVDTPTVGDQPSDLVALIAQGDIAKGERVARRCKACHVFEDGGQHRLGPVLWGIVGRDIASHEGFSYSNALLALEGEWTFEELDAFLTAPKSYVSGTKMVFAGLKKEQDRADLLAYLNTLSHDPLALTGSD